MSNEVLVKVENVSKKFCRDLKRSLWYGLSDITGEITGRNNHNRDLRQKEFWALNDISFELKRGEVLGLIGRNGAGKTTLLKVLNNLIKPDSGKVTIRGRVGALIALGAGFNPILTGRENVYVNGAVLGLTKKEIDAKFDEIVDFAELWDFIDTPVQSYSSGMQVRLGFAVASSISPEILIIDEVLAVGDSAFRGKCYTRIADLKTNSAVIMVSHSMNNIGRLCSSVLTLDRGTVAFNGSTDEGISIYYKLNQNKGVTVVHIIDDAIKIINFRSDQYHNYRTLEQREPLKLQITGTSKLKDDDIDLIVTIKNIENIIVAQCPLDITINVGHFHIEIETEQLFLNAGNYMIDMQLRNKMNGQVYYWGKKLFNLHVAGAKTYVAPCLLSGVTKVKGIKNETDIPLLI